MGLGIVHLLVLSGSQISVLATVLRGAIRLFLRPFQRLGKTSVYTWGKIELVILVLLLAVYVKEAQFPAPLVRAFLCQFLVWVLPFQNTLRRLLWAFVLHILFFQGFEIGISFALSWIAYVLLIWAQQQRLNRHVATLLVSFLCQCVVVVILRQEQPTFQQWILILLMNLLMIPVFEAVIFPLVAVSLLVSLTLYAFQEVGLLRGLIESLFELLMPIFKCVVVVLMSFLERITFLENLFEM